MQLEHLITAVIGAARELNNDEEMKSRANYCLGITNWSEGKPQTVNWTTPESIQTLFMLLFTFSAI